MGSLANWRRISPRFENDFQILLLDQRGHGRSFHPDGGYAPVDYAKDLAFILDELGWDRIHLVGHSMGGRNALEFANLFPKRTTQLVVEDIGPEGNQEAIDHIERLLAAVPTPFPNRLEAKAFFENDYASRIAWYPQSQVVATFLYTNLVEQPDGTQDWRFSKQGVLESVRAGRDRDRWDLVKNLSVPTLWLRGGQSQDLPRPIFEKILSLNPYIQGHEIPDSGHWIHFDQPDAFIAQLKEFLTLVP